jgi:hypothetical protein
MGFGTRLHWTQNHIVWTLEVSTSKEIDIRYALKVHNRLELDLSTLHVTFWHKYVDETQISLLKYWHTQLEHWHTLGPTSTVAWSLACPRNSHINFWQPKPTITTTFWQLQIAADKDFFQQIADNQTPYPGFRTRRQPASGAYSKRRHGERTCDRVFFLTFKL